MSLQVRKLIDSDIGACIKLFYDTIHAINTRDYSLEQVNTWAPDNIDINNQRWQLLLENISFVAELNKELVGFIDMTCSGYLDRLYVHKDYQGKGIATVLLHQVEKSAREKEISEISTEASITAKPFFESRGFDCCVEQKKSINGIQFINYLMKKKIA